MNYGLNISASGVLTSLYRQDVLTNNLANINTPGYKADIPATKFRDAVRIEDGVRHLPSNAMLERLGAGVLLAPNRVAFGQGPLERTGGTFDLAIQGDGFFRVRDGDATRLTRDGRFTVADDRRLVMASTGMPLLDAAGLEIRIPNGSAPSISADGTVTQNDRTLARIALVDVPDRSRLGKLGQSLFEASEQTLELAQPASGTVVQGSIEGSSVNEVRAILQVQRASRSVSSNIGIATYQDRLMERAINTFGRVA